MVKKTKQQEQESRKFYADNIRNFMEKHGKNEKDQCHRYAVKWCQEVILKEETVLAYVPIIALWSGSSGNSGNIRKCDKDTNKNHKKIEKNIRDGKIGEEEKKRLKDTIIPSILELSVSKLQYGDKFKNEREHVAKVMKICRDKQIIDIKEVEDRIKKCLLMYLNDKYNGNKENNGTFTDW
eukprot:gene7348-11670_t